MGTRAETDCAQGDAASRAAELVQERTWLHAARKDPEKFHPFYDKYAGRLRRYLLHRTGDPEVAADLLGVVFAKALDRLPGFRWREVGLGAWLFRIAANEVCDHFARERRLRLLGGDALDENLPAPDAGVLSSLVRREVRAMVHGCVDRLAERDRAIFRLHYWEGLKTREVAERLRMSENTVKTRLVRGRAALRAMLGEAGSVLAG